MISREKAIRCVANLFQGVVDKAGAPYIEHCRTVALRAESFAKALNLPQTEIDEIYLGGLFHDVVEDLPLTVYNIKQITQSERVAEIVSLMTHNSEVSYDDYLSHIFEDIDATIVKCADLLHNSEISRFKTMRERKERVERCNLYFERAMIAYEKILNYTFDRI